MKIEVQLQTEAIPYPAWELPACGHNGALAEFYGIVRGNESGERIGGLEYEAYTSMALTSMQAILEELGQSLQCDHAKIIHRHGPIRVGEAAIYVGIQSPHRKEAFAMLDQFMDRLKQDVPIWKTGVIT